MLERAIDTRSAARRLMGAFAERTGLVEGGRRPVRYLWTDAFAVCNFLGFAVAEDDARARKLAVALVDQVHHVLGQHRDDDSRSGWISGLGETDGEKHPTIGGLRIGKPLPERGPDDPANDALEWERDGQYFHYLTKWMRALDRVARVTADDRYLHWGIELARTAFSHFSYPTSIDGPKRMVWKMSIDLTHPQVASMGHHDPLDGLITFHELASNPAATSAMRLDEEIGELSRMCAGVDWATNDPLGIGGLLADAFVLAQLDRSGRRPLVPLLRDVLWAALTGLRWAERSGLACGPAERRLGFRELGLSIGIKAIAALRRWADRPVAADFAALLREPLSELARYEPLAVEIESFWLRPENQSSPSWEEHRDINEVMLATSLAPAGFLALDCGVTEEDE